MKKNLVMVLLIAVLTVAVVNLHSYADTCPSGEQASYSCPYGFTLSSDKTTCYTQPICPAGSSFNSSTDRCEYTPKTPGECNSGYTYDVGSKVCYITYTCPDNSTLQNGKCVTQPTVTCQSPNSGNYNLTGYWCFEMQDGSATEEKQCYSTSGGYLCPIDMQECTVNSGGGSGGSGGGSGGSSSISNIVCSGGGSLDTTLHECALQPTPVCPSGYTPSGSKCVANPECPSGSSYNASTNRCEMGAESSGNGTCSIYCGYFPGVIYIQTTCYRTETWYHDGQCYANYSCVGGLQATEQGSPEYKCSLNNKTYSSSSTCSANCKQSTCPSGWSLSGSICYKPATCPAGGSLNTSDDKCESAPISYTCPSGYTYNSKDKLCEAPPQCPDNGTFDNSTNTCASTPQCPDNSTYSSTVKQCVMNAAFLGVCDRLTNYPNEPWNWVFERDGGPYRQGYFRLVNGRIRWVGSQTDPAFFGQWLLLNGGSGTSEVEEITGSHGIQIQNGKVRFFDSRANPEYGQWIGLDNSTNAVSYVNIPTTLYGSTYKQGVYVRNGRFGTYGFYNRNDYDSNSVPLNFYQYYICYNDGKYQQYETVDECVTNCPLSGFATSVAGENLHNEDSIGIHYDYTLATIKVHAGLVCGYKNDEIRDFSGFSVNPNATTTQGAFEIEDKGGNGCVPVDSSNASTSIFNYKYQNGQAQIQVVLSLYNGGEATGQWVNLNGQGESCATTYDVNRNNHTLCIQVDDWKLRLGYKDYEHTTMTWGRWITVPKPNGLGNYICPQGWTLSGDKCYKPASCPSGYVFSSSLGTCVLNNSGGSGGSGSGSGGGSGSPTYTCPAGNYQCLPYNGKYYCSPNPCVNMSNDNNTQTQQANLSSYTNDGQRDANGNCLGQIYIFNGKGYECRTAGVKTTFTNCCSKAYKKQGKVLMVLPQCNKEDALTDQYKSAGLCHYVGKYCSWKVKFLGCLQHKKVYCCFHSVLARIVQEQGRPQLKDFGYSGDWGDPKDPNCRGFTPKEFQMLDFDKIDLSEYFGKIEQNISKKIKNAQQNAVKNIQNFYNQIK